MIIPPLSSHRARELVARMRGQRILVVGDVMLDRFIVGRVTRISPEAPVPVVTFQSEFVRLGGAANVAQNLASLGAQVSLVGVVGRDVAADRLSDQLSTCGVGIGGLVVDAERPTVEKVRVVTDRNQQVARIDYEDDRDITGSVQSEMQQRVAAYGRDAAVLLVSDYLKGAVTGPVMSALDALKAHGAPLLIDPKVPHLARYAGASLITPNLHEAEAATHLRIRDDAEARAAAVEFRFRVRCHGVLITRGEQGMWLSSADAEGAIPAVAREVSDVTGAGDTVVATLALALAAGGSLAEAAMLANQAAGLVVGKFGPATVTGEELLDQFPTVN
jgi:D-glycero-beta-D-manno-heptose-7-phosphate kinase